MWFISREVTFLCRPPSFDFLGRIYNNTRNIFFSRKKWCVFVLFFSECALEKEGEKAAFRLSFSPIKNTPTKESFLRDTLPFFIRGGRQRRRCETTRNNKETDDKTNNCGGSSPFCIFLFRAGVAPHLRFFLRFSFSSFFLRARRFSICVSCFWRWLPHRSF